MRQRICGMAILGLAMAGAAARAQTTTVTGIPATDPFSLYYGWYLPQQAALAVTPRAETPINQLAAIRQQNALTERAGLYDPVQPFGSDYDPANPFARSGRQHPGGRAVHTAGSNGHGPPMYFNRTATYYPTLRTGRSMNSNVAAGGNALRLANPTARRPTAVGVPSMPSMPY